MNDLELRETFLCPLCKGHRELTASVHGSSCGSLEGTDARSCRCFWEARRRASEMGRELLERKEST